MDRLFYLADLFGVAVFAITGALMAGRKSMDLFGVLVIAIVTALGGGTLRDLILDNHPVSWIRNDTYIWVASLAGVGTVLWVRMTQPIHERGLLIAERMINDGTLSTHVAKRYAEWDSVEGRAILDGQRSLAQIATDVEARNAEPQPISGRQEYLENLVNTYL